MKYAIIGSGAIGNAVATQFARNHQSVVIANSRGKDSLAQLSAELGSYVTACDLKDAMSADMIVLATPFEAAIEVLRQSDDWQGKIVVDATNAIAFPSFSPKDLGGRASSRVIAEAAPGASVVKTFNTMWARVLKRDPQTDHGKRVLFLSGDDADANKKVVSLVSSWGFEPVDLGGISEGGLLMQFGGPLTTLSLISQPQSGPSLPEMDLSNN